MKVIFLCRNLADSLSDIKKTVGAVEYISLNVTKKGAFVSGTNKINTHVVKVAGVDAVEPGKISLPLQYLEGVIKNREKLAFTLDNHAVHFESVEGRKYEGEITPLPYEEHVIETPEDSSVLEFSLEQVTAIDRTFDAATLTGAYEKATPLPVHLRLNSEGIRAICGDPYHTAVINDRSVSFDAETTLSLLPNTFTLISGAAKSKPYKLSIGSASIIAQGSDFKLEIPFIQYDPEEALSSENNVSLVQTILESEDSTKCEVSKDEFVGLFNNAYSFYSQTVPLHISVGKKTVNLSISTTQGSAKETMKCESVVNPVKEPFKVEMCILEEFLQRFTLEKLPLVLNPEPLILLIHYEVNDVEYAYACGLM